MAVQIATGTLVHCGAILTKSGGELWAVFADNDNLYCYRSQNGGTSWSVQGWNDSATMHGTPSFIWFISAAMDSSGYIHVVSQAADTSATRDIAYSKFNTANNSWSSWEQAAAFSRMPANGGVSIALDSNGAPHVLYTTAVANMGTDYTRIYYTNKASGSWLTPEAVSTGTTSNYRLPCLIVRGSNTVEAVYGDTTNVKTWYRVRTTSWGTETTLVSTSNGTTIRGITATTGGTVYRYCHYNYGVLENGNSISGFSVNYGYQSPYATALVDDSVRYVIAAGSASGGIKYTKNSGSGWDSWASLQTGTLYRVLCEWAYNFEYQSGRINYLYDDNSAVYFDYLSLGAAAQTVNLATLTLVGSVPALDVVPGAKTITLGTLTLASTIPALTVHNIPPARLVTLSTLTLAGSVPKATILKGGVTRTLSTLTLASTIPAATILKGGVTRTLATLTLASSIPALSVTSVPPAHVIPLGTLTLASSIPAASVLKGAVTVTLDTLTLAGTVPAASVRSVVTILLDTLTLASAIPAATVLKGGVTVALSTITLAGSILALTVEAGGAPPQVVNLATLTLASSIPTIRPPGSLPDTFTRTELGPDWTVGGGAVAITSDQLTSSTGGAKLWWNATALAANQWVSAKQYGTGWRGITARVAGSGNTITAYVAWINSVGDGVTLRLGWHNGTTGWGAYLDSAGTTINCNAGQTLKLVVEGQDQDIVLKCYVDDVLVKTLPWSSFTDQAAILNSGRIGLYFSANTAIFDDFDGGTTVIVPLSTIVLASSIPSISVTAGAGPQTITLSTLTLAGSVPAASVLKGGVTVTLGTLTLAGSVPSLKIGQSVYLNTLTLTSSIEAAVILKGGVTVTLSTATLVTTIPAITVIAGGSPHTVALATLTLAGTIPVLSVLKGGVTLALDTLTLASAIPSLSVVAGAPPQTISLSTLTLVSSAGQLYPSGNIVNGTFEQLGGPEDYTFMNWVEVGQAGVEASTTVHSGSWAARLTAGSMWNTECYNQPRGIEEGKFYALKFWTRGDGTNAGIWCMYDNQHSTFITQGFVSTGVPGTTYQQVTFYFKAPCSSNFLQLEFLCPETQGGVAYYDDADIIPITGVALSTLTLASSIPPLMVRIGAKTIPLATLTLASTIPAASVVKGGVSVTLGTLTLASSIPALDVVPGAITVGLDTLTLASTIPAASVITTLVVSLDTLTLASTVPTLDVVPGTVTVGLDTLTLAGSIPNLTVIKSQVVGLSTLTLASSIPAADAVPGGVAVGLDTLALVSSTPALDVVPGGVTVTLDTLTLVSGVEIIDAICLDHITPAERTSYIYYEDRILAIIHEHRTSYALFEYRTDEVYLERRNRSVVREDRVEKMEKGA